VDAQTTGGGNSAGWDSFGGDDDVVVVVVVDDDAAPVAAISWEVVVVFVVVVMIGVCVNTAVAVVVVGSVDFGVLVDAGLESCGGGVVLLLIKGFDMAHMLVEFDKSKMFICCSSTCAWSF